MNHEPATLHALGAGSRVEMATVDEDADTHIQRVVATARRHPETSRVRYRINNGEWRWDKGVDFLALWDQPFAGTIYIDHAVSVDADRPAV